jgi:hypothetical protein
MSDEIKENESVHTDDINEENEGVQSDEIIEENDQQSVEKVSIDEQEENDPPLLTPNGRETPSGTSFADVVIEKQDDTHQLVQTITDKSNKEASSTILNTVIYQTIFSFLKSSNFIL